MNITFPKETYIEIQKAGAKSPVFHEETPYRSKDIEARLIVPADFDVIKAVVEKEARWTFIENRRIFRKIENLEKLKKKGAKKLKITKLEMLVEALRELVEKTPNKWLFIHDKEHKVSVPYFVSMIKFHPTERFSEPQTKVTLKAMIRGAVADESLTFRREDLGATAEEILSKKSAMLESDGLVSDYKEELERYRKIAPREGEQYLATGIAQTFSDSRWNRDELLMEREGEPSKIVIDDQIEYGGKEGEESGHYATTFWDGGDDDEDDTPDEKAKDYILPVLPFVRAFDLWRHEFILIYTSCLKEYVYDTSMANKIVLPDNHRKLIEVLVSGVAGRYMDVVKGKAKGVIILCTGVPGSGKTLSSEVYAEVAKRPLYMVQCSQLGTDPDALEKNLAEVLERATRWRAILLIDEADVYIHERGSDVGQNAIVGVFLRLLEYYNGILFMNTNREEVIDDAILSRATAHVKYENPSPQNLVKIWRILAFHFGVTMNEILLASCIKEWKNISGRDVRKMLRLAKTMADQENAAVALEHLKFAASFQDLKG